jgi:eukaryotic-like serine/threonine-protein kinase
MPGVPEQIGPYRVTRPLGQGGMGAVYLARDTRLDRDVALKLFSGPEATSAAAREQVLAEARAAAAFNHPHIASVHDVLDVDGQVAIVFEYVEGETLADRLKRGRLTTDETVAIGLQLTDALAAAHQHGIVHRDLKLANIAITSDGIVKVLDFGVARVMPPEADADAALTTFAGFVGTLGYAPPEQALGQSVDARADVFAMGVVLFEMLSARRPFPGRDAVTVVQAMLSGEPPRVRSLAPEVPPELDGLIARMLARDPARRPSSARQVRDTLESLAPTARGSAAAPPVRRRRRWAVALLLATALTAALSGTILWNRPAATADRPPVVAVLPLTNASGDASKDYLAIGFAESLITRLASLPSVTVLSRAAVADARGRNSKIPALATELDVSYFVDGTVQQVDEELRISLNLIERDGAVAWADTVEGPFDSIFALQTRVASALGHALVVRLSPADRASLARQPTTAPEALDAYWRGRALLERRDVEGNLAAALDAFDDAISRDPRFAEAHAARGEALWAQYVQTLNPAAAQAAIDTGFEALRLAPNLPQVRYSLALTLSGSGKLDEAVEELQRALALQPRYDDARRLLGTVLARQGRIDEAVGEFRKAIDLRPGFWGHHSALGVALFQSGRHDEAADAFREVIRLQPDNAFGYQQLGTVYHSQGHLAQALEQYRRANAITPVPQAYSNIGAILHQQGDYAGAVEAYRQAIELRPNAHIAHRNLGDALRRLGRTQEADNAYRRAVALVEADLAVNPRDARTLAYMAIYLAKVGEEQQALDAIAQALAIAPNDIQVLYGAGVVYALRGRSEAAVSALQRAVAGGFSRSTVRGDEDLAGLSHLAAFQDLTTPLSPGESR